MDIFDGIDKDQLKSLLNCLQAVKKTYKKNELIIDIDENISSVGYLLTGTVEISKEDFEGNRTIINHVSQNDTFAETMVCAGIEKSLVCVKAVTDTEILFINFEKILSVCTNACKFHQKLIGNIIKIIASKNLLLQERLQLLSKKTLKEKIMYMLFKEKQKSHNDFFEISYSREQMAEFIGADRSALSRELSKMKNEKILDYHKNMFKIIQWSEK